MKFSLLHSAIIFISGVVSAKLVDYMFTQYKDRKKIRIEPLPFDSGIKDSSLIARLSIRNTGAKDLWILKFGYVTHDRYLYEQIHRDVYVPSRPIKPGEPPIDLIFHDGTRHVPVKKDKVAYYFVETGSKTFYLYTCWRPLGWLKRILFPTISYNMTTM